MNFTMSFSELMPLAPVMIVALTAIVVMILTAMNGTRISAGRIKLFGASILFPHDLNHDQDH